jgi:hypothetical protein
MPSHTFVVRKSELRDEMREGIAESSQRELKVHIVVLQSREARASCSNSLTTPSLASSMYSW